MIHKLAKIHARYGVYTNNLLIQVRDNCILDDLDIIPELSYLNTFYKNYFEGYEGYRTYDDKPVIKWNAKLVYQLRNVDLPFIGPKVIENKKAKYFWIFQGSLQPDLRLTMTVLSCLWLIDDIEKHKDRGKINNIIDKYWTKNAYYEKKSKLRVNSEIAQYSYVVDAQKLKNRNGRSDNKSNRNLLLEEIDLFMPDLIIAIGGTAKYILGEKYINDNVDRFVHVPFPRRWAPPHENYKYELLEDKIRSIGA